MTAPPPPPVEPDPPLDPTGKRRPKREPDKPPRDEETPIVDYSPTDSSSDPQFVPDSESAALAPSVEKPKLQDLVNRSGSLLNQAPGFSETDQTQPVIQPEDVEPREVLAIFDSREEAAAFRQEIEEPYRVLSQQLLSGFGFVLVKIDPGENLSIAEAIDDLRARFEDAIFDANARYYLNGSTAPADYAVESIGWDTDTSQCGTHDRIGLIDTPLEPQHPALVGARLIYKSVVTTGTSVAPADHGTAVAALLVGRNEAHRGLLPRAELYAINVFRRRDKKTVDTTAEWILRGLDVLLSDDVKVINLSLGGPPNQLMELAVYSALAQDVVLIASAGNDGPNGKPVHPAAYEGVIAVTGIDAKNRIYKKANRGEYVAFAAPGVDLWTASADGKGKYVSGTSFAAPFVTAAYVTARALHSDDSPDALTQRLVDASVDLGDPGRDPVFGWGLIQASGECAQIAGS